MKKLAWPYDPNSVAQRLQASSAPGDAEVARDIGRGATMRREIPHAARLPREAFDRAKGVADKLLSPAEHIGPHVLRGAGNIADYVSRSPRLSRLLLGGALAYPMMNSTFNSAHAGIESEIMNMRRDPSRVITASLDDFLEKKREKTAGIAGDIGKEIVNSFSKGIGGGIGTGAAAGIFGAAGAGVHALRDYFMTDNQRKQLVEMLIRTDPIISDAVSRNENGREVIYEAYGTMVRFAPSLALDVNAVRSFLREAIIGGAGVNYATIKNLVETEEKALKIKGAR